MSNTNSSQVKSSSYLMIPLYVILAVRGRPTLASITIALFLAVLLAVPYSKTEHNSMFYKSVMAVIALMPLSLTYAGQLLVVPSWQCGE